MAGHSQFKNIMHRKGAQDAKRAKLFTKLVREIIVAAKSGPDPDTNPRLRAAMLAARAANLPKDRIMGAIEKASSTSDGDNYEEVRYEGYGPGGVAIIVEALTDNRNRTASEVRSAFSKHGGNLGESGSVSFGFRRVGAILYPKSAGSEEDFFEASISSNAMDCNVLEDGYEVITAVEELYLVRTALEEKFGDAESAGIVWQALNMHDVNSEEEQKLSKMIDALEDCDDVQSVFTNFVLVQ